MDETRQSPKHFLKEIEKEKHNLNRGHLKIFFGYAAGVGKRVRDKGNKKTYSLFE